VIFVNNILKIIRIKHVTSWLQTIQMLQEDCWFFIPEESSFLRPEVEDHESLSSCLEEYSKRCWQTYQTFKSWHPSLAWCYCKALSTCFSFDSPRSTWYFARSLRQVNACRFHHVDELTLEEYLLLKCLLVLCLQIFWWTLVCSWLLRYWHQEW